VPRSLLAAKEEKTILNATTHPYFTANEEPLACIIIAVTIHHVAQTTIHAQ
jgi:galactose mutarotase-like enzyme